MGFQSQLSRASFQKPVFACFLLWGLNQMTLDVPSGLTFWDSMDTLLGGGGAVEKCRLCTFRESR